MRSSSGHRATVSVVVSAVACVVFVVLLAGCGGEGVTPREWADRVCQALKPWTEEIDTLTRDAQAEMSRATSPEQAKTSIVALLAGAEQASEDARQGVVAAGVPAVEDGDRIAREFRSALRAARDAYGSARKRVAALPTGSADAFYDHVVEAMETLSTDYRDGALDTSDLSSEELQRAFDESPECR